MLLGRKIKISHFIFISLYLALKTVYTFESGGLQIADVLIILFLIAHIFINNKNGILDLKFNKKMFFIIYAILFYQFLVNLVWYYSLSESRFLTSNVYYFYNFFIITLLLIAIDKDNKRDLLNYTNLGFLLGSLISLIGIIINDMSSRSSGFFNNPNQLAYYSILSMTFVTIFWKKTNKMISVITLFVSILLIFESASKAGFFSATVVLFMFVVFNINSKSPIGLVIKLLFFVILVLLVYLFLFTDLFSNVEFISYMRYRIFKVENDNELGVGRGYSRVFELDYNIIWGTGEGGYERFEVLKGWEINATYPLILVCYGFIGTFLYICLFVNFLGNPIRNYRYWLFFSGVFIYFITHNGLRNTIMWFILVLIYDDYRNSELSISEWDYEKNFYAY